MDRRQADIISGGLVIVAMLLLAVPRVAFPTTDSGSFLGVDVFVLLAVVVILLAVGNVARHLRADG